MQTVTIPLTDFWKLFNDSCRLWGMMADYNFYQSMVDQDSESFYWAMKEGDYDGCSDV